MKKLIGLAMIAISSASAQDQGVLLFGDLVGDPRLPPGTEETFDVFFTWNLSTEQLAGAAGGTPFCDSMQTATVTVKGHELVAIGSCESSLGLIDWNGSVEEGPPSNGNWFGEVNAHVVSPTAAPEPGTLALMLTGLAAAFARWLPRRSSLRRG